VELIVTLPEAMLDELRLAARDRGCSPRQFAIETLESAIASRRLPKAEMGTHGAFTSGMRGVVRHKNDEPLRFCWKGGHIQPRNYCSIFTAPTGPFSPPLPGISFG